MRVSTLKESDYDRIHYIFKKVFDRTKWEEDFYVAWRERSIATSLGAYSEDGRLLAYAITRIKYEDRGPYCFLEFLAVDPEIQGGGIGTTLLHSILKINPKISLIPVNNDKLIHWYKKQGFHIVSEKKDRWGDPELLMSTLPIHLEGR